MITKTLNKSGFWDAQKSEPARISDIKIFNLYDISEIKIEDQGLKQYINLQPKIVLKSHGRNIEKFGYTNVNLVERFVNRLAVPGHRGKKHKIRTNWASGKYSKNLRIMLDALKIVEEKTKQNPVQVLVKAIENAAPRDEITVIEYGGARYPQAVDISPSRRLAITIRYIVHGAYDKAFNKKASIAEGLAKEIVAAYEKSSDSLAMIKKNEAEKQADSAR